MSTKGFKLVLVISIVLTMSFSGSGAECHMKSERFVLV